MADFDHYQKIKAELKEELMKDFNVHFNTITHSQDEMNKNIFALTETIKPIARAFNSASNFRDFSIIIMKGIVLIGAALGALYAIVEVLKVMFKSKVI